MTQMFWWSFDFCCQESSGYLESKERVNLTEDTQNKEYIPSGQMYSQIPISLMQTNPLTRSEIYFHAVNGGVLSGRVKQQQQDRFQNSIHIIEGQSPDQPALSSCTY